MKLAEYAQANNKSIEDVKDALQKCKQSVHPNSNVDVAVLDAFFRDGTVPAAKEEPKVASQFGSGLQFSDRNNGPNLDRKTAPVMSRNETAVEAPAPVTQAAPAPVQPAIQVGEMVQVAPEKRAGGVGDVAVVDAPVPEPTQTEKIFGTYEDGMRCYVLQPQGAAVHGKDLKYSSLGHDESQAIANVVSGVPAFRGNHLNWRVLGTRPVKVRSVS